MDVQFKNESMINDAEFLAKEILQVRETHYVNRKSNKLNFNFFEGLVNGKTSKTHLEKFHSNFLSYLLNPNETHDCDDLFLNEFTLFIQRKMNLRNGNGHWIPNGSELFHAKVEREKPADGRSIDIAIESQLDNQWIIFIENKIRHYEGINQFVDYYKYSKKTFKNVLGIYLSLDGSSPGSVKNNEHLVDNNEVAYISYSEIIEWLEVCIFHNQLAIFPHITSAIKQYVEVIKFELKIMENKEIKEILSFLENNPNKAITLVRERNEIVNVLEHYIKEKRDEFLNGLIGYISTALYEYVVSDLSEQVEHNSIKLNYNGYNFKISIEQSYLKADEGGKGLWWGIYNDKGEPLSNFNIGKYGFWEGVIINGLNDFDEDTEYGSRTIVEASFDKNLKKELIKKTGDFLIISLKEKVFPIINSKLV